MEAGRRVSFLASAAAPRRTLDVHRIALAVLLTVASFAVVYLITANAILRTRVLRDLVSEGDGVELDYVSAYSVWPGRVHFRGLTLAVQDYNLQFSVISDAGVVEVSLADLLWRRFHATSASLEGLSFRLRPKVEPEQANEAKVAAFPSIPGFADPPVRVGPKPSAVPDAEYDLWQVAIDEVRAELRELWFLEYRYVGAGRITRGGFRIQPGRSYAVYPARVELARGALSVGDDVAVQRLALEIEGHVNTTDVRTVEGPALADAMNGRLRVDAHGLNFGALDAGATTRHPRRIEGEGDLTVSATLTEGRLGPDSTAELSASRVELGTPVGTWSGSLSSSLKALPGGRLEWVTASPKLAVANASRHRGPVLSAPRLSLVLQSETVARAPSLREVRLDLPHLVVPSLAWGQRWMKTAGVPLEIGGRLEGRAHFSWMRPRGPSARVHLRLADAEFSTEKTRASLGGEIDAKLDPADSGTGSAGRFDIELDGVEVERVRERTKPFRAAVRAGDLRISLGPELAFSATVDVSAKPADSLLSLALGSPMLEDLAADVFDLRDLEARARLNVSERAVRLELARAASGGLTGAGYWQRPATGDARGAFLISSDVANVGISLVGSQTETAWFVADDWLASSRRPAQQTRSAAQTRRAARPEGPVKPPKRVTH
jgi:hypothetical protein